MRILLLLLLAGTAHADPIVAARMLAEADRYSPEVMLEAANCPEDVCTRLRARALDKRSAITAARARIEAKYADVTFERREILIASDGKLLYGVGGVVADRRKASVLFRVDVIDEGFRVSRFELAGDRMVHASFVTYDERPDATAFR